MKKSILISSALACAFTVSMVLQVNAHDYLISFAGAGAATVIDSVEVENLSEGATIAITGEDIFPLSSTVGDFPA